MADRIIGRKYECDRLDRCMGEHQAQLIVVYGRRRVGKTYLVQQYFDGRFDFKFTGAYRRSREDQLTNFTREMSRQTGLQQSVPKDWDEAFVMLRDYLSAFSQNEKRVVFFDEMPWMDTQRSGFMEAFEWFWNDWGAAQENLIFIACGSSTSWMIQNFDENKGGLFNRQTCRLYLMPFTLGETEQYLQSRRISWARYDIAECYMIMGGIPYYLSLLDPQRNYQENIDNLFFRKRAELWDEFDHLYQTLFENSEQYIKVVEILGKKRSGMTRPELSRETGISSNGKLTKMLKSLTDSGFVREYAFFGHKKKETVYQLADYYTAFFFRFIKDNFGKDEHFWSHTTDNPARRAWAGLTFEQLCKDHIAQIKRKLGIAGVLSEESTWYYRESDSDGRQGGTQIDMLIDRRDRVINLCEIKFSINEFAIDKKYDQTLRNKIDTFRMRTDCKKTIQLTMITTFGVKRNTYSGLVGSEVVLDDLFVEA